MANNFGRVNVSVTASTGGLTAGLGRASKQLRGFQAQTQGMTGTITNALAGFVGMGRGATMAAIGVRALSLAVKSLLGPLLIVTSLVALFAKIGSSARDLDEAGKTARRLGMSMTSFQNLGQVAEEAGVSMQQMGTLLTFMTRNIGNLANGSTSAQKAFGRLGLAMADLQGLSPERQFELISQRIMALPTAAERTAAAMSIFGRQGAMAMGLIGDAASGAVSEIAALRQQLGLNLTDAQVKGIEMMNDALGRVSLVFQGFINQFLAGLAPAVTTVSNLVVKFFAENTSGWSMATTLANVFSGAIRTIAGAVTFVYGAFQTLQGVIGLLVAGAIGGFALIVSGLAGVNEGIAVLLDGFGSVAKAIIDTLMMPIQGLMKTIASAADAVGFTSIADDLRQGVQVADQLTAGMENLGDSVRNDFFSSSADQLFAEAEAWGVAASDSLASGLQNITNPYAAFDAEFANVTAQMQQAGAAGGAAAGEAAGSAIGPAIAASTQALSAIVVGTSEAEAFRNSMLRGADPRNEAAKDGARTADATERTADAVEELAGSLDGFGLAEIGV